MEGGEAEEYEEGSSFETRRSWSQDENEDFQSSKELAFVGFAYSDLWNLSTGIRTKQ